MESEDVRCKVWLGVEGEDGCGGGVCVVRFDQIL